ncbi:hypothetical protein [Streptomyces mirabilis]
MRVPYAENGREGVEACREIAYLLGGSIHAQSTQDEGSCFTLYL